MPNQQFKKHINKRIERNSQKYSEDILTRFQRKVNVQLQKLKEITIIFPSFFRYDDKKRELNNIDNCT